MFSKQPLHSRCLLSRLFAHSTQEESSNISQITKMGIAYRFQEGKVIVNHNKFLGYTKNENGELVIVPEEAELIKRIYREYLDGKSPFKIAAGLQLDGKITGSGGFKWYDSTVDKILKNEKYMGDALLQKSYTVDFLTKKRVKNNGIVQQYYVEDSHPPIVPKAEFAAVQAELVRRSGMRGYSKTGKSAFTSEYPFSGKLFCQSCGSKLRHTFFGTGKNKRGYWLCINHQMNGSKACTMRSLNERHLEQAFVRAMNKVIGGKDTFIATLLQNIYRGLEVGKEEFTVEQIDARLQVLQREIMSLVRLNAKTGIDTRVYDKEYSTVGAEIESMRERRQKLKDKQAEQILRVNRIQELKDYLITQENELTKFDEDLFRRVVEKVKVESMVEAVFVFKTGVEVREILG